MKYNPYSIFLVGCDQDLLEREGERDKEIKRERERERRMKW